VLRLLVRGHDIKSIARELSISTTAANERLRSARQKLGVSSSREAARVLAAAEGDPTFSVDTQLGVAASEAARQPARIALIWIGVIMAVAIVTGMALMAVFGNPGAGADAPTVIQTNPSSEAVVAPGPLKLSVTFDRPMRADSYSFVQKDPATFPNCGTNAPEQLPDGRTFTLQCTVEPDRNYEIWFNSGPYMNFKSLDGTPANPFQLKFRTKGR
jgi:hypothetical protein